MVIELLDSALQSSLRIRFDDTGTLKIVGPRTAASTAQALAAHRPQLAAWFRLGQVLLDWHDRPLIHHTAGCLLCCEVRDDKGRHPVRCHGCGPSWDRRRPDLCRWCRRIAHFRDDDGRPVHKVCTEEQIWRRLVELRGRRAAA